MERKNQKNLLKKERNRIPFVSNLKILLQVIPSLFFSSLVVFEEIWIKLFWLDYISEKKNVSVYIFNFSFGLFCAYEIF